MVNRGKLLGFAAWVATLIMASLIMMLGAYFQEFSIFFTVADILLISLGGFIMFWSFTLEGNTWISRMLGGQNVGISIMGEPGTFGVFSQLYVNKPDFERDDNNYTVDRNMLLMRKGLGIPYIFHSFGHAEPIDVFANKHGITAAEMTSYLNSFKALIRSKLFNEQFFKFQLLQLVAIGATIIVGVALYFVIGDLGGYLTGIKGDTSAILTKLPTITPAPGVMPNV